MGPADVPPLPQLVEDGVEGVEGLGRIVPRQVAVDLQGEPASPNCR